MLSVLAVAELGAWLTLSGTALVLATAAVLAGTFAFLAAQASGMPAPRGGNRAPARRVSARKASATRRASAEPKGGGTDG